ncbi:hydrogenase maturation protease [Planktothrix sp. FACHB-1365]|uniref:hydrogenase maturation protease n=1 Tax=Planktothrix sp. FACHB-1365 TaxID=2692855 RepID=UPI0016842997|nr:hydrogenase maturation protease [Planktothrix sp. FACHB-1365]MBD2483794.1 hydrogenase maturation protease [Planktothrix sp. FACHB-1365]
MILIIGYGNPIRGDDGIGQAVIAEVEQWNLANVRSQSLHQLTPEIAAEMAEVETVIFVDAGLEGDSVNITSLEPLPSDLFNWGHSLNPRSLLSLTQFLYQKSPQAWLIAVPGENFELSETLSPKALNGIQEALKIIKNLIKKT